MASGSQFKYLQSLLSQGIEPKITKSQDCSPPSHPKELKTVTASNIRMILPPSPEVLFSVTEILFA